MKRGVTWTWGWEEPREGQPEGMSPQEHQHLRSSAHLTPSGYSATHTHTYTHTHTHTCLVRGRVYLEVKEGSVFPIWVDTDGTGMVTMGWGGRWGTELPLLLSRDQAEGP